MNQFNHGNQRMPGGETQEPQDQEHLRFRPIYPAPGPGPGRHMSAGGDDGRGRGMGCIAVVCVAMLLLAGALALCFRRQIAAVLRCVGDIGPGTTDEQKVWGLIVLGIVCITLLGVIRVLAAGAGKGSRR